MANFKEVNKAISKSFPDLKIKAVRGDGYVYFVNEYGHSIPESMMVSPTGTSTSTMSCLCILEIEEWLDYEEAKRVEEKKMIDSSRPELAAKCIRDKRSNPVQKPSSKNLKGASDQSPTYTKKQHDAIKRIMDSYKERNRLYGRERQVFNSGVLSGQIAVGVLVKDLDDLCYVD